MIRFLLTALCSGIALASFAQNDSIFLKSNADVLIGKVVVNLKKKNVVLKKGDDVRRIPFNDIAEVRSANGKFLVSRDIKAQTRLLVLIVKGKFSLLFSEDEKLFYVQKSDSLLVISQAHFKRALPIIFGKELFEQYHSKSNIQPQYSARYFKNLVYYVNEAIKSEQIVYEQNLNQFKTSLHTGPYVGFGYNRTGFDVNFGMEKVEDNYKKTKFSSSYSVPVGLSFDLRLSKRVSINLDTYLHNTSNNAVYVDNMGFYKVKFPLYLLTPEKFVDDLKMTGFSFKTVHFDLSASYAVIPRDKNKLEMSVFAGPSIVSMTDSEIQLSAGYRENKEAPVTYMTRWSKLKRPYTMIGINAGVGAKYPLSERLTLNLAAKFIGGIYPKIENQSYTAEKRNETPMPDDTWQGFFSRFDGTYDQYTRIFTISGSLSIRL
jgi:hypothetical protein